MIAKQILVLSRSVGLVREVQAAAGTGVIVTHHDRLSDIEEHLSAAGPFDVIVAGPVADSKAGLARLSRVLVEHPATRLVLALPQTPKSVLQDIVRCGAVDLIPLPASRQAMRSTVRRALAMEPSSLPQAALPAAEVAPDQALGEVLTIASPSGGCGKTFYSTNLAFQLQRSTGQRVCLVDLDLQFGEVSTALRLKPRLTMTDAVTRSELDEIDLDEEIEQYLVQHSANFWVLAAPRTPEEADRITPPDVTKVVSALRRHFGYVVLDTSAQLSEIVLTAMDQSTRLLCMATLDLPSIRNMRVFIETLEKLKIPTDAISVILNKVEADMGIRVDEANQALHHKIISVLPYAREVSRSINEGVPVLMSAPKAAISTQLAAGMAEHLGLREPGAGDAVPAAAGSGTARLRRQRSTAADRPAKRRMSLPWRRTQIAVEPTL